jgi:predicted esterase
MFTAARLASLSQLLGAKVAAGATLVASAQTIMQAWQDESTRIFQVNGGQQTTATVIFTHGLGDTGMGWSQSFQYEVAPHLPHVRFLFPTARNIPVSLNGGMSMPAWYDISSLDRNRLAMEAEGIVDSCGYIQSIAAVEAERLKSHGGTRRVVIGGFSQGAALSIFAAHTYPESLGGVVALSGYMTARKEMDKHFEKANAATPLFMAHGTRDPVVPYQSGKDSFDLLVDTKRKHAAAAVDAVFETYQMEHTSNPKEMADLVKFLKKVLPEKTAA